MIKIGRLLKSFLYAWRGLFKIFKEEQNLRIQLVAAVLAAAAGFFLRISRIEWLVLAIVIAMVILMEIVNSVVERVADVLKPRIDHYAKEIKDIAAAAVMVASIAAAVAGAIIFYPYLFR